ncbi:unnamed protein product [Penicillium bialowiezense]
MSSPSPSATDETQQGKQIHFKFCRECSNLLYPKEDRATNQLMFTCRTCHVGEPATSYCVYQNKLHSQVGDTAGVTQDVASDPTVRLPISFSPLCGSMWQPHYLLVSQEQPPSRTRTGLNISKLALQRNYRTLISP